MNNNALIKGIAYYHPKNKVDNAYFIDHFKKQGIDIDGLLSITGRQFRYISNDTSETILTMGYCAAKSVLEKTHVKASDINLLVFSSGTPEYIAPTNAVKLHDMLGAGQKCCVYDLNANCAGMLVAFDQVSRVMRSNPNIKYALLIGSDQLNKYSRYNEAMTYANFGDSACAILLENVFHTERGFIDSDYYTNSSNQDKITLPAKGMSEVVSHRDLSTQDKLFHWIDFDFSGAFNSAIISIEDVLFRNNLKKTDIKYYFLSQFAWKSICNIQKGLGEDLEKFPFIGNEFGYTGTTSPFLVFAKTEEDGKLEIGDYYMFWTVGAGTTCACILYRY